MDAGRGQDRLTIVEQPRPPTTFYPTSMDISFNQQQQQSQLRASASYGDLCRAQGPTDALSAAYHSRYLASLPGLTSTSGANFPFNMFASGPSSPFRAPSAPGIASCGNGTPSPMRHQLFWPPTPPPDGYGRYGLNTSLFPLFGAVSPSPSDGGAAAYMLAQGLVSRHLTPCTTTASSSHHILDPHKDQGFYSPGYSLGSPLTPSSQLTTTNPFSHHLIPPPHPLDYNKFPSYCPPSGLNSSNTKDFLADDSKSQPHHHHHHHHQSTTNCQPTVKSENSTPPSTTSNVTAIRHSHPPVTTSSKSSRSERKSASSSHSPGRPKDIRHTEDVKPQTKNQEDSITKHYQSRQHQHYFAPSGVKGCSPFEIDISCGPAIKPDILSPPIDSSSDATVSSSPYQDKKKDLENGCSTCANDVFQKNDIPKIEEEEEENNVLVVVDNDDKSLKSSRSKESAEDTVPNDSSTTVMAKSDETKSHEHSESPKNVPPSPIPNPVFLTFQKTDSDLPVTNTRPSITSKHVTAAVIPTAPKQPHLGSYHHNRLDCSNSSVSWQSSGLESDIKGMAASDSPKLSALSKIKSETTESSECTLPVMYCQNPSLNCCRHLNSSKGVCTKVKDMIKSIDCTKKQNNSLSQVVDGHQTISDTMNKSFQAASLSTTKLCPVIPEKSVQGKVQGIAVDSKKRAIGPLKTEAPVYRFDSFNNSSDSSQKPMVNWSKATVSPFNWQQKDDDQQAINLTVDKKNSETCSPIPSIESLENKSSDAVDTNTILSATSQADKPPFTVENIMATNTTTTSCCVSGTGVIGVCHPNVSSVSKAKMFAVGGSVSKFSAVTSVMSQMDVRNDGEVHLSSHSVHSTKSSTFQTLNAAATACLNRAASVTGFQNTKTQLKTERLTPQVRPKSKDNEKVLCSSGRPTTLATLAPKLTKKVGFLKDSKSSHTMSTSSSVSSTSIVFPATVNPCIPVGIAIAQQRQDSSGASTAGKHQASIPTVNSGITSSATQLTSSRVSAESQQPQEILRDQKLQEIGCPNSAVSSESTNFLVTQGPTIVSRQWESEAVTRATLPSPWVAQGSIVAPALWIGQGATAATAYATTATTPTSTQQLQPHVPTSLNPMDASPISLPPGGYQLARDSVTGHLFLIPSTNIVDRTPIWPSYNHTAGNNLPIQQLVTQQHHTQFEQMLPQVSEQEHVQDCLALSVQQTQIGESSKDLRTIDSCCDTSGNYKTSEIQTMKTEDKEGSSQMPLASGQTFTFTFPTPCDPSGFSYVLQSSTVMHLAHTAQATSIQTESGKRSQGTSPLHPATPSPSPSYPSSSSIQMCENTEEEGDTPEDSDGDAPTYGECTQVKLSQRTHSVTTAVQVDMDSRTNSEEEEEIEEDEVEKSMSGTDEQVAMFDSAIQTENIPSYSGKIDSETEILTDETQKLPTVLLESMSNLKGMASNGSIIESNQESNTSSSGEIIVTEEGEIAPSLPVESKPVMDFIDHHGLDLLVDSIEEFASRGKNETKEDNCHYASTLSKIQPMEIPEQVVAEHTLSVPTTPFNTLDTTCTDGLGLLCALAEQRLRCSSIEESLNTNGGSAIQSTPQNTAYDCYSFNDEDGSGNVNAKYYSPKKDNTLQGNYSPSFQKILNRPGDALLSSNQQSCERKMMEKTQRLADLEKEKRQRLADLENEKRQRLADLEKEKMQRLADLQKEYEKTKSEYEKTKSEYKKTKSELEKLKSSTSDNDNNEATDEVPVDVQKLEKTSSIPHFKHKTIGHGKSNNHFHPSSFKTMAQKHANNRAKLANTLQKKNVKKPSQKANELSNCKKLSSSHSKSSHRLPDIERSETCLKKKKTTQDQISQNHNQSHEKLKIGTKNTSNDGAALVHGNLKIPSPKMFSSKDKSSFLKKTSMDDKHKTNCHSKLPTANHKSGVFSKSSQISSEGNNSHEKSKPEKISSVSRNEPHPENLFKRKAEKSEAPHTNKKRKLESIHFRRNTADDKSDRELSHVNKKSKSGKHSMSDCEDSKDEDGSKVPFFDEQAWCVRRSERIFLSDARPPPLPTSVSNSSNNATKKTSTPQANISQKPEPGLKDKKENAVKLVPKVSDSKPITTLKCEKDKESTTKAMKNKFVTKSKSKHTDKKRSSSLSGKSSRSPIDSDSSDDDSSTRSDRITAMKAAMENIKRSLRDSDAKLARQNEEDCSSNSSEFTKPCKLDPSDLQDQTRVLALDDGLYYAGHIVSIRAPDVYGIFVDGKRAHHPHIYSREEILNSAVLEIKPTKPNQLPEGTRVCAYWSQQTRCLYPGTVAKSSSLLLDPSKLFVEFDDGDSGKISLHDIRMLPPDFPIVSTEPDPPSACGKRKPHSDNENTTDKKIQNQPAAKTQEKDSPKIKKKKPDGAVAKSSCERSKSENRPSSSKKSSTSTEELNRSVKVKVTSKTSVNGDKNESKKTKIKEEGGKKKKGRLEESSSDSQLKSKKRKKHRDEHKHHHKHKHHHHKHHHKKHKQNHSDDSSADTSKASSLNSPSSYEGELTVLTSEQTSDLTVTIKTSPSPHTTNIATHGEPHTDSGSVRKKSISSSESSDEDSSDSDPKPKTNTKKKNKDASDVKPAKRKERVTSVEKSKIAAFLPALQLWRWSGKGFRRPGAKGKGKKEFYRAIQRGKELLRVGDSAVFLSTGRPHLPYIGRIETMWGSWGGKMDVRVKWFYHPEETKSSKKLPPLKGALFQSTHFDENDVQTISHKCEVLSWEDYQRAKDEDMDRTDNSIFDNDDTYYLAGTYDPITRNLSMEPGIPKIPIPSNPEN